MDHRPLITARLRGALVASLVALLVASLLPTAAFASHNEVGDDPCAEAPPANDFADYESVRQVHQASVDCALYRGVTSGAGLNAEGEPIYRPRRAVTRDQMAQFIVNTIVSAGYDSALPDGGGRDEFRDISDNFAREAINRLARADIVRGVTDTRYNPDGTVTRQQMASFIVQAARFVVGEEHPVQRDEDNRFRDVSGDNIHKRNIEAGADAGLFSGTSATTFHPGRKVIRDQMATFLVNLLDYTYNPNQAPPPYVAQVNIADRNAEAGGPVRGDITGENIESAAANGCGLSSANLTDRDAQAQGIQFEVTIPADQPPGDCELEISVTFTNNAVRLFPQTITVAAGNMATVTLTKTEVSPGEAVTGEIVGSSIKSATVTGCGMTNQLVEDTNSGQNGIQFSETIPANQPFGQCSLTFTVNYNDNTTETLAPVALSIIERTGVTVQPELVASDIVSTTSSGTTVRYLFDEPVTGGAPSSGSFHLYGFNAARETGTNPRIESTNSRAVIVTFGDITTSEQVQDYTVATVSAGAVTDDQGEDNPEGDIPLGAERTETIRQPGATAAPDLESVSQFRRADDAETAVNFGFDEAAYVVDPGGFHLVMTDGTLVNCEGPAPGSDTPAGGTEAGGDGTTTITVVCPDPADDDTTTPLSATNVARGYVDAGTVADAEQSVDPIGDTPEGNDNPLEAADTGTETPTTTPDLVSATFTPGTGNAADQVTYTFDEVVLPVGDPNPFTGEPTNLFRVYDSTGAETEAETAERGSDTRTVVATFENGTLTDAVGASVYPGAVTAAAGDRQPNRADEVGVANSTTRTITPGRTAAPDLIGVALNPDAGTATYTFDENVNDSPSGAEAIQPMEFFLWLADGSQLTCFGVPGTSTFTISDNTVTCGVYRQGNGQAANSTVGSAVLGTVAHAAVDDDEGGETKNPEGAEPTTGGTGTPES